MAVLKVPSDLGASIVLIGPSGSGKSTTGRRLADLLRWAFVDLDELRPVYYPDFGIDHGAERAATEREGLIGLLAYWKPFELRSVERVMQEYPRETVIAFGGGQSVYVEERDIAQASAALGVASRVVLLMPNAAPAKSIEVLLDRIARDPNVQRNMDDVESFLVEFRPIVESQVRSESNVRLATEVLITGDDTPEIVADSIAT